MIAYTQDQINDPAMHSKIIEEIEAELNNQYDNTNNANSFQIVSYGQSLINPLPYNPGQIFQKQIRHNLGYAPAFLVFSYFNSINTGEKGFFSFPFYDGDMNFYAASDPVYLTVNCVYDSAAFLDSYTYQFVYYIYNTPAVL